MKAVRIMFVRKEAYTVDLDKLPEGCDPSNEEEFKEKIEELRDSGELDDICRDYEEFDEGIENFDIEE